MPDRTVVLHALHRPVRLPRHMKVDQDQVLSDDVSEASRLAVLSLLYGEIWSSWRELVGVRFKLLGLVPAISGAALAALLDADSLAPGASAAVASFGLLVTAGLFAYDQRNSQLHDELISRGRRIEYELSVEVGQFRGRPGSRGIFKHDYANDAHLHGDHGGLDCRRNCARNLGGRALAADAAPVHDLPTQACPGRLPQRATGASRMVLFVTATPKLERQTHCTARESPSNHSSTGAASSRAPIHSPRDCLRGSGRNDGRRRAARSPV